MSIEVTTLPNGLRIVTDIVPSVESVAIGVWVDVGTRFENLAHNGAAHMVEHMLFKGTKTRNALEIVQVIENVGGHMNAYTSREMTSYHVHLLKDDLPLALDVLADIVQNSTMPEEEIERERGVILQEIGMCTDTPDDVIFDHYFETAYPNQALGAPILGRTNIIESMQRDTLMNYVAQFYSAGRLVICASGNFDKDELLAGIEKNFNNLPIDQTHEKIAGIYEGGEHRENRDLEQSHIVLGFQGISQNDDAYYSAQVLASALGGGMSSRLFQEVREKRGLVYSIYSFHSAYSDDGQFAIYAGTGPDKLPELIPVVCDEILGVGQSLTENELERAKAQLRSSTLIAREYMMNRADQHAKSMILRGKLQPVEKIIQSINAVTLDDIGSVSQQIFASKPTLAALGPLDHLESYDTLQSRLAG